MSVTSYSLLAIALVLLLMRLPSYLTREVKGTKDKIIFVIIIFCLLGAAAFSVNVLGEFISLFSH